MRRYVQVSGAFFAVIALVQLTRAVLGLPVRVGTLGIPVWPSAVAFLLTATFAVWAFRTLRGAGRA